MYDIKSVSWSKECTCGLFVNRKCKNETLNLYFSFSFSFLGIKGSDNGFMWCIGKYTKGCLKLIVWA